MPYVLTNCHNSLCAVGGTINEDDHVFGLSAARKYGGIFVPAHQAVIHQYVREAMAGGGRMILGSDSHTRYGALGTMGIGEGGPELVKQLLGRTYDLAYPGVVAVYLEGRPADGIGPQDVALALIGAVFGKGLVRNKVLEFVGPGIANLTADYRNGIDVMTTETACLSSIWQTDGEIERYYRVHGRQEDYQRLAPAAFAYYDGLIRVNLSRIEPMIALPFHPSNVFTIAEVNSCAAEILREVEAEGNKQLEHPGLRLDLAGKLERSRLRFDQGVVAGCAGGTFENLMAMAEILEGRSIGDGEFGLSVYPASQPINLALARNGATAKLMAAGATLRTAFCGPCFGAGDVPANGGLSARHTTRNFPHREGSKPGAGQLAAVALMDARSIAATALHGGLLTPATDLGRLPAAAAYSFDRAVYDHRIYHGFARPRPEVDLRFGPNIVDWPQMPALPEDLLLQVAAAIHDPVTTTDELIPSGETSSYRSNPLKLAEFTLSRKDPAYVGRAREAHEAEKARLEWVAAGMKDRPPAALDRFLEALGRGADPASATRLLHRTGLGSLIYAAKPGDGSAREQAASCQKVLGGWANIALEYATKRYRSNLINWGLIPFIAGVPPALEVGDYIYLPGIRGAIVAGGEEIEAHVIGISGKKPLILHMPSLTKEEREIILAGCLINYYAAPSHENR